MQPMPVTKMLLENPKLYLQNGKENCVKKTEGKLHAKIRKYSVCSGPKMQKRVDQKA